MIVKVCFCNFNLSYNFATILDILKKLSQTSIGDRDKNIKQRKDFLLYAFLAGQMNIV